MRDNSRKFCLVWLFAVIIVCLSVLTAIVITPRVGDSEIDIGLDIIGVCNRSPVIRYGPDLTNQLQMEQISEKFATSNTLLEFEIVATGKKNPGSSGTEVVAGEFMRSKDIKNFDKLMKAGRNKKAGRYYKKFVDASTDSQLGGWQILAEGLKISSDLCSNNSCVFHYKKYLSVHVPHYETKRYIAEKENRHHFFLYRSPRGGIAIVRTTNGERTIDLYSDTEDKVRVDVIAQVSKNARYRGVIRRREFSGARIIFPQETRPDIYRLYLAGFIPKIFFKTKRQPIYAIGNITENWKTVTKDGSFALSALAIWERGGMCTFVLVFLLSGFLLTSGCVVVWAVAGLMILLFRPPFDERRLRAFSGREFRYFLVRILIVLSLWMICFYPGLMSPDSVSQWKQAHGDKTLHGATPVLHTLIWRVLFVVWDSPAVIVTTHVLAMSFVLAYAYSLLLRMGVPMRVVNTACLASMISVRNGLMTVLLWKGTLHAVVILGLGILLVHLLYVGHKRVWLWIILGFVLALAPLIRHNGLSVYVGMLVLLPVFFWHRRKGVFIAVCSAVVFYGTVQLVVLPALKVHRYQTHMPAHRSARYIAQDVPLSQEEYELVDRHTLLFKGSLVYTNITSSGAVWKWPSWPMAKDKELSKEVMRIFEPTRFLGVRILNYLHRHKYVFWPPSSKYDGNIETQVHSYHYTRKVAEEYGLRRPKSLFPWGHRILLKYLGISLQPVFVWFAWRGGFHFWLILAALGTMIWRRRDYRMIVIFLPVLLHAAGLLAVDSSQCARLLFPMTFATGFLACLVFVPLQEEILGLASSPKYK